MINFKSIHIIGYSSIDEVVFDLQQPGLNVIRGKVGAGKTNIPSALSWGLFGKSLKDKSQIQRWEELKGPNYKGVKVEIVIDIIGSKTQELKVTRCLDYTRKIPFGDKKVKGGNNLFITIDGEPYTKARNKTDKQREIEKLIGYSFDLFKNSIVFGQKMKRIIEETGPNKKKVFDEAFDVGFIDTAKEQAKEDRDKLLNSLTDLDMEIESLEDNIENNKDFLSDSKAEEKSFRKDKKEKLKDIQSDIDETKEDIAQIKSLKPTKGDNVDKLEIKLEGLETKHGAYKDHNYQLTLKASNKGVIQDSIKALEDKLLKKQQTCNHCGSILDKAGRQRLEKAWKKELKESKAELKVLIQELKEIKVKDETKIKDKIRILAKKIVKINEDKAVYKSKVERLPVLENKLKRLNTRYSDLENRELEIKSTKYEKKVKKLEKKLKTHTKDRKKLKKSIRIKDWLIKEPLSNKGLKTYMFDSLLSSVNFALEKYSRILGFQVEFGIDLDSRNKDFYQLIHHEGIIKPYEDLSGGQKQLVDTSIAFAIHDAISNMRPTNLMFMDEPFESLGNDEIEIIEELVSNKAKDKCLFLITHHASFSPLNVNQIDVVLDDKGISHYT